MVRVDEKWIWGEGGQKSPKMSGRPLYTVPSALHFSLQDYLPYLKGHPFASCTLLRFRKQGIEGK